MDKEEIKQICLVEFLIPFEGYAKKLTNGDCLAYPDPGTGAEPYTIGFGSTYDQFGVRVKPGDVWTAEKAMRVKKLVFDDFLTYVLDASPTLAVEPSSRVAAVVSWVYNCGKGNYRVSTFKKRLDAKDWNGAMEECLKWDKAAGRKLKGLTRRRQKEGLFILLAK